MGGRRVSMDKKEFAQFTMALKTYYPRENLLPNNQAMELWFRQLQDIPYNVAELSLNKWVATNKWSPSVAEIRQTASEVCNGEPDDWSTGWDQVMRAIRCFGSYRELEALDSMDELTRTCVKRLGFRNICTSENQAADRANFRMMYESLVERKKKENQLPEELKVAIEAVKNEKLQLERKPMNERLGLSGE